MEHGLHAKMVQSSGKCALTLHSCISVTDQAKINELRSCASLCQLANITRATAPSLISSVLESYDATIRHTFAECTGIDATDVAWDQAQLSICIWAPLFSAPFSSSLHCIFMHCH